MIRTLKCVPKGFLWNNATIDAMSNGLLRRKVNVDIQKKIFLTNHLFVFNIFLLHEDFNGVPRQYLPKPFGRGDFKEQSKESRVALDGG